MGFRRRVQDLPERNTAEDEAPEGQRSVEVMRRRKARGGGRRGGGAGGGDKRKTDDIGGSEVLCLRHGGRLREAGEDTQHGSILSQETLVHPPQGLDLSQSRESLHRGAQKYREGRTQRACREAGHMQREKHIQRHCVLVHSYRHAPTHLLRKERTTTELRDFSAAFIQ